VHGNAAELWDVHGGRIVERQHLKARGDTANADCAIGGRQAGGLAPDGFGGGQPAVSMSSSSEDEHREQLGAEVEFLARVDAVGIRIQPTGSYVQHLPRPARWTLS
jgi:outer membrane lipoprotein SlyB